MKYNYMLLGRLQMDLDYYLGFGGRNEKHLFYSSIEEHIRETINLWKLLPVKPEWLRATKLIEYKNKALKN
ncbi:hypothetical protein Phi4:1_gp126 [Cellulophaga phage phi4:1]|uniref:Large polyvalent protein-associated domain-containing protein n=5 Tax=Lightbulbvirus TaxID=1918522 RepID=A0A0S2MWT4_9CAUD|nr:hypothetical protein Phi4:1_gp126 [Cellulophaga phage phi4:1]YP_008241625.1 hypothetical protein Phi17:2_gp130 [Cellulophaga phage phi17:2]ALO80135.1 hypothetical protein Phi4113_126 [Cellulophaga phage phi4:1_13]ALO80332.1 hypothetical protein Phi4118_126 [Cellulophaga phage phi4:1_18]ALO80533.1 hypothetical protein Phi17218_130 [Cellulophaga phage phi17:2_18]AGO47663.1 hypothetical protein Phi17:2_gp130 [Cellulophaga phage phi17:2]AGO49539.1 hypothetical protein Phi4:1_gp126 [Cellulophag